MSSSHRPDDRRGTPTGSSELGPAELARAMGLPERFSAEELTERYDAACAFPLEVGRGGLREGVVLELLDRLPAVQAGGR